MSVDIEALAGERWFNELTPGERKDALAELGSAAAYDAVRTAILRSREALAPDAADPLPRVADTADLRAAMRRRAQRIAGEHPSLLARLLEYRVPAYQPALLVAAMLLLFLLWRPQQDAGAPPAAVREKIVYVPMLDTGVRTVGNADDRELEREKIVQEVTDSLLRELDRRDQRREARLAALKSRRERGVADEPVRATDAADERNHDGTDSRPNNIYVGLANLPQLDVQRKGKTFAEDSGAARFNASVRAERN